MTDRSVTVQIGAVLQSNFRTSFRKAQREVQSLTNAIGALGARRSNTGLLSIRYASMRLGGALRTPRTETQATTRALSVLEAAQKSNARFRQAVPNMDTERNAFGMIKSLEMLGHARNRDEIADYMEKMTSASIASGGKVTGEDFRQFAKYAKGALSRADVIRDLLAEGVRAGQRRASR